MEQNNNKVYGILKNKMLKKFLIFSVLVVSVPVCVIYFNLAGYLSSINQFLSETNVQLSQVAKGEVPIESSELSLELISKNFNKMTAQFNETVQAINLENIVLILLTIILVSLIAVLLMNKTLRRISLLEQGLEKLNSGDFDFELQASNNGDELDELIIQFNQTSQTLSRKEQISSELRQKENEDMLSDFEVKVKRFIHEQDESNKLLQDHLIPQYMPDYTELNIIARQSSEDSAGNYLFIPVSDTQLGFIIVDIAEKSMTARFLKNFIMIFAQNEFKASLSLKDFCQAVDSKTVTFIKQFNFRVSVLMGLIDFKAKDLSFVNCGFKNPLYFSSAWKGVQSISSTTLPLGNKADYEIESIGFQPSDSIFFYNQSLALKAQSGQYKIKFSVSDKEFSDNSSFHGLSKKIAEVIESGAINETMVLLQFQSVEQLSEKGYPLSDEAKGRSTFEMATQLFLSEEYEEALQAFKRVVKEEPTYLVKALNNIGLIYYKMKKFSEAKKIWEKVLVLDPKSSKVKQNLQLLSKKVGGNRA